MTWPVAATMTYLSVTVQELKELQKKTVEEQPDECVHILNLRHSK